MLIGDKIKSLRKLHNVKQKTLYDYLKIGQSTLANWERNEKEPSLEMLNKIAEFFNMGISELLEEENTEINIIVKALYKLNKDEQIKCYEIIKTIFPDKLKNN